MGFQYSKLLASMLFFMVKRMNPRTLCRFRQTSKCVHDFIDENRFKLACRDDATWIMVMTIRKDADPQFQCFVTRKEIYSISLNSRRFLPERVYLIENPVVQLSAIRFDLIQVATFADSKMQIKGLVDDAYRTLERIVFTNCIVPILEKLRPKCNWFSGYRCGALTDVLHLVCFERLDIQNTSVKPNPTLLRHAPFCKELCIDFFAEEPHSLSHYIGYNSHADLRFQSKINAFHTLGAFLQEVRVNNLLAKNLQYLRIWTPQYIKEEPFKMPEVIQLWKGKTHEPFGTRRNTTFAKTSIGERVLLLVYFHPYIDALFVKRGSREELYDCLYSYMFHLIPYDASSVFQKFLQAESDMAAFSILSNSYN